MQIKTTTGLRVLKVTGQVRRADGTLEPPFNCKLERPVPWLTKLWTLLFGGKK